MEITILKKEKGNYNEGDLLIKITKEEAQELKDCGDDYQKQLSKFLDFLEKYSCNGSYFYFEASDFDALSESPCIGDCRVFDNENENLPPENFWFFSNYMITNFTEDLRDSRETIFEKA